MRRSWSLITRTPSRFVYKLIQGFLLVFSGVEIPPLSQWKLGDFFPNFENKNLNLNFFLCPQRIFGRHIVIALSVRPSVLPSVRPCVRPCVRPSRFRVQSISPIFFEVGISNLVCGCILGWRSVAYHFWVTVTLTSDLVFRIIMSGAYLLYFLR